MPPLGNAALSLPLRRRRPFSKMTPNQPMAPSSTPSARSSSKRADSNILRGAEIIREQIRRQLEEEDGFRKNAEAVRDHLLGEGENLKDTTCSFSTEDDFSDPWAGKEQIERRVDLDDEDTLLSYTKDDGYSFDRSGDSTVFPHLRDRSLLDADSVASFPTRTEASAWADISTVLEYKSKASEEPPPPPPPLNDDTPVTRMGRGRSMKAKIITYLVQALDHRSTTDDEGDYGFVGDDYGEEDIEEVHTMVDVLGQQRASYLPPSLRSSDSSSKESSFQPPPKTKNPPLSPSRLSPPRRDTLPFRERKAGAGLFVPTSSPPISRTKSERTAKTEYNLSVEIPSPLSIEYTMLMHDPAYLHAQNAGYLWQSIVGQQVRFPSSWWNGARSPPMGVLDEQDARWQYLGRYQVRRHPRLNKEVKARSSPGRLLLHIVVQDLMTLQPVQDIAIGCFHPNARGIRPSRNYNPNIEYSRDLWLAVRKHSDSVSAVDSLLSAGESWLLAWKTPLGGRGRITNQNVRAVYGESPPLETVFVPESELYERLLSILGESPDMSPPLALLEEFLFS